MMKLIRSLLALLLCVGPADAQFDAAMLHGRIGGVNGGGALSVDGTPQSLSYSFSTTGTVNLTTSNSNDFIVVAIHTTPSSGNSGGPVVSVTSTHLTFTRRARQAQNGVDGATDNYVEEWTAVSSGTLSSEAITVTQGGAYGLDFVAFAVSGVKTGTPFDSNASLPAKTNAGGPVTISTSHANDFILGIFGTFYNDTPPAGYTVLQNTGFYTITYYKIVSATQSSLSLTTGFGGGPMALADAFQGSP